MAVFGLCHLCEHTTLPTWFEDLFEAEPVAQPLPHCYGRSTRSYPGVIDGYVCICECKDWVEDIMTMVPGGV